MTHCWDDTKRDIVALKDCCPHCLNKDKGVCDDCFLVPTKYRTERVKKLENSMEKGK